MQYTFSHNYFNPTEALLCEHSCDSKLDVLLLTVVNFYITEMLTILLLGEATVVTSNLTPRCSYCQNKLKT